MFGFNPNKIQRSPSPKDDSGETEKEENKDLDNLLSIKKKISSYKNGEVALDSLNEKALEYLESNSDIDLDIDKLRERNKKENEVKERLKTNIQKRDDLINKIKDLKIKYKDLDLEYERRDGGAAGRGSEKIGDEMEETQKEINQLEIELDRIEEEIEYDKFTYKLEE